MSETVSPQGAATRAVPRRARAVRARKPFDARKAAIGIAVWLIALVVVTNVVGPYYQGVVATIGLNALLAMGLVLVTGLAGQFSLAQAAFYGVGAYGSALLTVNFGWPAWAALIFMAAVTMSFALALGPPIFRLRGHFLAMGTLALTEIFFLLMNNLSFTGGASGFGGIESFNIFGYLIDTPASQLWFVWIILGIALWGCLRISVGREGRALRAIRGHEAAAESSGINVLWSKSRIFAASALIGSVAGSVYAHQILYVNPPPFSVTTSIDILAIAVLGGIASPWGAIIGAFVFELIRQLIDAVLPLVFGQEAVGAGEGLAFGVILVLVLVLRPDGLVGLFGVAARQIRRLQRPDPVGELDTSADLATERDPDAHMLAEIPRPPTSDVVALSATNLSKTFGGVKAVDDVTLTLFEGEILAVIGPNGAGKSTLQNLLSGNLLPTSGSVTLTGSDVTGWKAHRIAARGLARTFQTPSLFAGMTTRENALIGAYLRGRAGLWQSALPTVGAIREEKRVGAEIDEILARLGLAELSGQIASELSLGQQKMVELARAVARSPKVLLLDEPGAGLNRVEKLQLSRVLQQLRADGLSMILIEHDMEFVMGLADRVHVLEYGRTLKVGSPSDVQNDPAVISAYLGIETSADALADEEELNVR